MNNLLEKCLSLRDDFSHVSIDEKRIHEFADLTDPEMLSLSEITLGNYKWESKDFLQLLTLFNAMNFTFWCKRSEPKWTIQLNDKLYDGSTALFKALEQEAISERSLLEANRWKSISVNDLARILKGNIEIPMLEERVTLLQKTGIVLEERYGGSIIEMVKQNGYDAMNLLDELHQNFESYQDTQVYQGIELDFLKRAQLHVRMISDTLSSEGKPLKGIEGLTAFADYKVPQILRKLGILQYSKELSEKIDALEIIEKDSPYEIEIRASTIVAVELIKREFDDEKVSASHVDSLLWLKSQEKKEDDKPYHRTATTSY